MVDYVIPGNDDAVRAIKVVLGALTNAIVEVNGGVIVDYVSEDESKKNMKQSLENKSFAKKEKKVEKPQEEVIIKEPKIDLNILTVAELRELAKKKEIKGYSKMKKDELIESLK